MAGGVRSLDSKETIVNSVGAGSDLAPSTVELENNQDAAIIDRVRELEEQLENERKAQRTQQKRFERELRQSEQRIKSHLSYRFGREIIQCGASPLAWAALPWNLAKAYRAYQASFRSRRDATKSEAVPGTLNPTVSIKKEQELRALEARVAQWAELPSTLSHVNSDIDSKIRRAITLDGVARTVESGSLRYIGSVVSEVDGDQWTSLHGSLRSEIGSVKDGRKLVCPRFFDRHCELIEVNKHPGCIRSETVNDYRYLNLSTDGDPGNGRFVEVFHAPAGTCYAAFYFLAMSDAPEMRLEVAWADSVTAETMLTSVDFAAMGRSQLHYAKEIADVTANLRARRDVAVGYSWLEGAGGVDKQRVERLEAQLTELDPQWLPRVAAIEGHRPDAASIMHLFKVIYPDESSGGAVRGSSIVKYQARNGLKPVVCMPSAARRSVSFESIEGIAEIERDGVSVNYLNMGELGHASPDDALSFEAAMHSRVLHRKGCSLIHASSGFRGYETALKGLALAKAYDLPMVYEVRSFHEHTWRSMTADLKGQVLTELRKAQENRCMREADAVVTISRSMIENLRERGVPEDKLFLVPNCVEDSFTSFPSDDEIRNQRAEHDLSEKVTIGYISNFSLREGHIVLLNAFTRLVAQGKDVHLVLVGDGPERDTISEEVTKRGLEGRVVMPGSVDHGSIKSMYHCIDLFVVPRIRDFASDYVTPLKPFEAMSQGIPLIMADVPVSGEIVGGNQERGWLFSSGDDEALAAKIESLLNDREARRAKAELARRWVLEERVWEKVVKRYDGVYARAREHHQSRGGKRVH